MTLEPVTSSFIEAAGYDPETKIMAVRFKNECTWHVFGVSMELYSSFREAPSCGNFFHENIRGKHGALLIDSPTPGPLFGWMYANLDGIRTDVHLVKHEDGSIGAPLRLTDCNSHDGRVEWQYIGMEDGVACYKKAHTL